LTSTLVVVGDALLDRDIGGRVERLSPDAPVPVVDQASDEPRPGGAGLAACLAAADGHSVTLVTALGGDEPGRELGRLLAGAGVRVMDLGLRGPTPEKVRIKAGERPLVRLDRGGCGAPCGDAGRDVVSAFGAADALLVADYGRGLTSAPRLRRALEAATAGLPVVWDPHPRGAVPVPGVELATPNEAEAGGFVPDVEGGDVAAAADRALALARRWRARNVCVTRGAGGAVLAGPGPAPLAFPAERSAGGDPCGAGDRFSSTAAAALAAGEDCAASVAAAVASAAAFVAAGGAPAALRAAMGDPSPSGAPRDAVARARAAGGTVVATGGCFDLLHTGHVRTLEAARALGDCLVVLLNSDASIRRIKGEDRPLVGQEDRAAVLEALGCVDAVVIFDEDTPAEALERVRPDLWVKGGDYAGAELPESAALARWGGRVVVLPYVEGRSTTRLIEEAQSRVG
jgi:D-beta-D-heptose 7-phosphate kinase/D-beta-D-heptose 1-phosphate adenosyltransferase